MGRGVTAGALLLVLLGIALIARTAKGTLVDRVKKLAGI